MRVEVGADDERLFLVRRGRSVSTIVLPEDALPSTKQPVTWLQEYVRGTSRAELKAVPESQALAGTLISVGHTKLAAAAGVDTSDLKYDGCKLVVRKNVLFLLGQDQCCKAKGRVDNG